MSSPHSDCRSQRHNRLARRTSFGVRAGWGGYTGANRARTRIRVGGAGGTVDRRCGPGFCYVGAGWGEQARSGSGIGVEGTRSAWLGRLCRQGRDERITGNRGHFSRNTNPRREESVGVGPIVQGPIGSDRCFPAGLSARLRVAVDDCNIGVGDTNRRQRHDKCRQYEHYRYNRSFRQLGSLQKI